MVSPGPIGKKIFTSRKRCFKKIAAFKRKIRKISKNVSGSYAYLTHFFRVNVPLKYLKKYFWSTIRVNLTKILEKKQNEKKFRLFWFSESSDFFANLFIAWFRGLWSQKNETSSAQHRINLCKQWIENGPSRDKSGLRGHWLEKSFSNKQLRGCHKDLRYEPATYLKTFWSSV
jgi:hypothetical protein